MKKKTLALDFVWNIRLKLYAEGKKLYAEGYKLWAEGDNLHNQKTKTRRLRNPFGPLGGFSFSYY